MSQNFRSKLVRLAYAQPELRPRLLPLLKTAGGGQGWNLMGEIVQYDELMSIHSKLAKADKQSADLLRQVMRNIGDKLDLDQGFHSALSRLDAIARIGERGIESGILRNNIFKAANSLGMKLPSGMFA